MALRPSMTAMKSSRLLVLLLSACLLLTQQGGWLHAMEHALALRMEAGAGMPMQAAETAHACTGVCAWCVAFAGANVGAIGHMPFLTAEGVEVRGDGTGFAALRLPVRLAFASRAPPASLAASALSAAGA